MPSLFPDLPALFIVADLVTHLRFLEACFRAAWAVNLAEHAPPPLPSMFLTLHLFVTRLPNRLVPARNALLAMHPIPPIFEGCAPPHLPTTALSAAVAEPIATAEAAVVSAPSGRQGRRRGGRGHGGGGGTGMSVGADARSAGFGGAAA
ncbi:unnamed protein product [Closterium sp. NIES-54]